MKLYMLTITITENTNRISRIISTDEEFICNCLQKHINYTSYKLGY